MAAMEMTLPEEYVCMGSDELMYSGQGNGTNAAEVVLGALCITCGVYLIKSGANRPPAGKYLGIISVITGVVSL